MAGHEPDIQYLLKLALDSSVAARRTLAGQISELTAQRERLLTEHERDLISQILRKLLSAFETPVRRHLAETLATAPNVPRDLLVTLANDQIEVALPVLLASDLLRDAELIEIVRHRGHQHQIAVARRRGLSEPVSATLVESENEDVIQTLLENPDASISETTMAYVVEASRRIDSYQEPLVNRRDLPRHLAKRLLWWVAAALRRQLLQDFNIHPTELDDALEKTVQGLGKEAAQGDSVADVAARLAERLAEAGAITPVLLIKVLRQGEMPLFEAMLAALSGIVLPRLRRLVYDNGGEGLAVICRVNRMPKQNFATMFMLTRAKGTAMKPQDLSRATALFDNMNQENAEHVLKSWQRDPDFQDAVMAVEESELRRTRG